MGLDQFAVAIEPMKELAVKVGKHKVIIEKGTKYPVILDDHKELPPHEQIHQWRKHPSMQGWMDNLYVLKGGTGSFNCVYVNVDLRDLDTLEDVIKGGQLPETAGFFFGKDDGSVDERLDDLKFVRKARKAIKQGKLIYYGSWW